MHKCACLRSFPSIAANPFVTTHPDLPSNAALGQNLEMMFVVGINSDGTNNNFFPAIVKLILRFNSTVLNETTYVPYFNNLPFTVKYQVPISTESEGFYTLTISKLFYSLVYLH